MAASMEKTSVPGLYKRGSRYTFSVRVDGAQRWYSFRTFTEARRAKDAFRTDIHRGEFQQLSRITLSDYLVGDDTTEGWIDRYRGTGKRGFREETRSEYRGIIEKYYFRPHGFFPPTLKITELSPSIVDQFVHHLSKQPGRRNATLSDNTIRNLLSPLRAAMASARREGLIRTSPVDRVALPHTAKIEEDQDHPRPFPPGVMALVVDLIPTKYSLMFELLAATGLRRSELLALEGRHLSLSGEKPHVKVRQRVRRQRGKGLVIGPTKSRYSRREVPISIDIADELRGLRVADDQLVFATRNGTPHDGDNLAMRVLGPACSEAGVEWAAFHTFRHSVASLLFAEGRSIVAVQRFLGHATASFTLDTYIHMLSDDIGGPLVLDRQPTHPRSTLADSVVASLNPSLATLHGA
jgi:integrase